MSFGIKTKHSLSNRYAIDAWIALEANEIAGFRLSNGNEIYFNASEIREKFFLNQEIKEVRKEIKNIIINSLNKEMKFNDAKIEKYISLNPHMLGGYLLRNYAGKVYIKNIDEQIGEAFFDSIADHSDEKNVLTHVYCDLELSLGILQLDTSRIQIGNIYKCNPKFKAFIDGTVIFNFFLGINEIMVIKEEHGMSIEDEVGEQIFTDEQINLDVDISLGKLEMSITQIQDLLVGDFIDISHLSFPKVELKYKNKKMAIAELVYNEHKELSIEIKEVLIK